MSKKRARIPRHVEKSVFQEARSRCSFCSERDVTALEIHHIDSDPSNNDIGNLLVVCASCHAKITGRSISDEDVQRKKGELAEAYGNFSHCDGAHTMNVVMENSKIAGDIVQHITKVNVVLRKSDPQPRVPHPPGSLGADIRKKGYIDYLITRYFELRKAEKSYGIVRDFSHAEVHKTIQREFGHKTFYMPTEFFEKLVRFLYNRIDCTVQGRRNRGRGVVNYHTFEQHLDRHDGK